MTFSNRILPTIGMEENFQEDVEMEKMKTRWLYSIPVALIYLTAVQFGQKYMESKTAWNLRMPLVIWSGLLAIFSWLGTIRITVFLVLTLQEDGIFPTVCTGIQEKIDKPIWFWLYLFVISKVPELGDTFFIVVRKSKLHFLHWYHHITVFVYSFYICAHPQSGMIWYAGMNFAVHALMYTYYTLRAAKFQIPRKFAMLVTTCQLSQMVVGVGLQLTVSYMLYKGYACDTSVQDIIFALAIYASYMVLFADFFYKSYIANRSKVKAK